MVGVEDQLRRVGCRVVISLGPVGSAQGQRGPWVVSGQSRDRSESCFTLA